MGEESPSTLLHSAQHDVTGRSMHGFALTVLVAELTRVVALLAPQDERITELEKALAAQEEVEVIEEVVAKK